MSRARSNRGTPQVFVSPDVRLSPEEVRLGAQTLDDWHWNNANPVRLIDWKDPDLDRMKPQLVECGRWIAAHVRTPRRDKHPRRERDTRIELSRTLSNKCHLVFDRKHPFRRLYILLQPDAQAVMKRRFWDENRVPPMKLGQLALLAGGRHSTGDYPQVAVKPVGVLTGLIYWTHKRTNPPSFYLHLMGEVSHYYPILSCDNRGRLWLAGGNYTAPNPGITD